MFSGATNSRRDTLLPNPIPYRAGGSLVRLSCTLLLVALSISVAGAEDLVEQKNEEVVRLRVARLIEDLAAPTYARRQAAEQEIAELGAMTRQQLEIAERSDNPEQRLRATRLLKALKIDALWRGTTVSLVADQIKASAAVREIAKQTGNDLAVGDQYGAFKDNDILLQHPNSLFWRVVDDLCRKSNNRVRSRYGGGEAGLVFVAGQIGQFPVAYAGPVRAQLTSAKRVFVEDLDYEDQRSETTHTFQFNVVMSWEHQFQLVAHRSHLTVGGAAVGDKPTRIIDHRPAEFGWQVVEKALRQYSTALRVQPPSQAAKRLTRLTLNWEMIAVGDRDTLTVDDLTTNKVHHQGNIGLSINELNKTAGTRWELTVAVSRDLAIPESKDILFVENRFELLDQHQRPFTAQNATRLGITNGSARQKLPFIAPSSDSVPTRLVVHYPRIRDRRNLEITFHDVPLPSAMPD